ncbi:MAG: alpha/beta fold hydrolase [Solirubrobacteraceae bacterium]
MATFILVHGAFAGGWCWEPVAELLEREGHDVRAPDLPGSGRDRTPVGDVSLQRYVERVCEELADAGELAILVGHGLGGIVITQVAAREPERIARLVYLAAFLPRDGQSLLDLTRLPENADDQVSPNLMIEGEVGVLSEKAMAGALLNCAPRRQLDWALQLTRPQPLAPLGTPVTLGARAPAAADRVYVYCLRDHAIPLALQRRMVEQSPCASTYEIDTDDWPFLSRPSSVARVLEAAAAGEPG